MTVLGEAGASSSAVEAAFAELGQVSRMPEPLERALLLQRVYRLATSQVRNSDAPRRTRPELLNALPPEQREVLVLSLHHVRCSELAEIHNLTWPIIAMRLHHGLQSCRERMRTNELKPDQCMRRDL